MLRLAPHPTRVLAWLLATACAAHAGEATEAASGAPDQFKLMIGSMLMTDYIYRGISYSAHQPAVATYIDAQQGWLYAYTNFNSVRFSTSPAVEVTMTVGARPTLGPFEFDIGAAYYYYPGFHEPSAGSAVGINKGVWESFDASDRRLIEAVAASEYARSLAEFNTNNAFSLHRLREETTVKILKFDDRILKAFRDISKDVVAEIGSGDDLSKKICRSYQQFHASITNWSDIAEHAVLNSRGLA